jgi:RHS repeat-associated protein
VHFAAPPAAQAQIASHVVSPPKLSADDGAHVARARLPKAPAQVDMPAPPAMKIFPGLAEPLVATGPVGAQETSDLDAALAVFRDAPAKAGKGSDYGDYAKPLLSFIAAHPQSRWNAALHADIGLGLYHDGYYTRALAEFGQAWRLGRDAASPQAHMLIDRVVGEMARMHASVGRGEELEALLKDIGSRPVGGRGAQYLQGAREALWSFRNHPEVSYLCGPAALAGVLKAVKAGPKQIKVADDARSGPHGFSLAELAALADRAKLKYRLIRREPGQPVPVPSIVNWSLHHYAAITGESGGEYTVADPTFAEGGDGARSLKAIDAESSGYFLVPTQVIAKSPKAGWRVVSPKSEEAKAVYGMGLGTSMIGWCTACEHVTNTGIMPFYPGDAPDTAPGMTVARSSPMEVSLHLQDTPVGYRPQVGLPNLDTISYNSREAEQPAVFPFSNLSAGWAHGWQAYVVDDPTKVNYFPLRVQGGGGGYYQSVACAGGTCLPETPDNSQLVRNPASGTLVSWVRTLPDGRVETYGLSNGAATYPRYIFLTKITDPQGNATNISYDSSFRVTSITDAMGRSTTFTYGLSGYPLLITRITDPFGRYASLTYDTSQRLASVTDPVGITSSFSYSATEPTFVTTLTTPYGTSGFNDAVNPHDVPASGSVQRSLTLTDPLGYTDFVYFYQNASVTPSSDPAATVPTGMPGITNTLLQWRNTYYWNKHQWGACVAAGGCSISAGVPQSEDFSKAALTHWFHYGVSGEAVFAQVSSIKQPLENRVWFDTWKSYHGIYYGTLDQPIQIGRVLDDGTTQLTAASYPTLNNLPNQYSVAPWVKSVTDPKGRITKYNYATNNIDLLTIQQLTASPSTYTTIGTYGSYNSQHEPQTFTGADGQTWNYTYTAAGQIKTITDPNSGVTTFNYDGSGRLSSVTNANSQTQVTYTYDSADRIHTRTDSEGYVLTYAYDNLDRVTGITYPDGTTDLYDYNFQSGPYMGTPSLELRKHTDRLGRVTTWAYDADRRLTSVTEPTSGTGTRTTSYSYYEDGTLKEITDASGNVTHWDIDIESRPTDKIYAYGTASAKTETYAWENTTSRLHSITDALSQVKTFAYGLDDRVTGITYTSTVNPTPNVTFAYDTYFPRLTSMTDGLGTTNYSYTAIGGNGALKLSSIDGPYSNDTIGLTYDALGRLSGRTITGGNETFGYDAISRLTSHGTPLGSFTTGYLGQTDQTASRSVTNGGTTVSTSWGYDTNTNDRRLIGITNSGVSRSYTLSYLNGSTQNPYDVQSITDTAASGHPWATQSHSYSYDNIDRLLTASQTTPGNDTYAYDALDNATTYNTPGTGSLSPTYNVLNQLATFGASTYSYDNNGNTLSGDGVKTYKWDAENRLIEIDYVGSTAKSQFSYDGLGHRLVDVETASGGGTTTTRYLWCPDKQSLTDSNASDGLSQAVGGTLCQKRDGSDNVLRRDLDEGEYNVSSGQKLVTMPDQLGSIRDVLDASTDSLVQSYDFTPYGAIARSNGTTPTDMHYAQLFYHPASALNISATRAQDGVTGRWLNRDSVRELAGPNLYMYVKAKPIYYFDPLGTCPANKSVGDCLEECIGLLIDKVNDISPIVTGAAASSLLGGTPVPKQLIGQPVSLGGSRITNPISLQGFRNPAAVRQTATSVFGKSSRNLAYTLGRANAWLATGIALFGSSAVVGCTYQCLEDQPQ